MQRFQEIVLFLLIVCARSQRPHLGLQPRPETCDRPADFMYLQCCVFPPFFTRDVAKACGAFFEVKFIDRENNVTAYNRQTNTIGCEHWECVLKKYGFLTRAESLDDEKFFAHLDKWTELNPMFTTVMTNAQVHCKNTYRMFMPLTACEFFNFLGCIRNFITLDCPVVIPTKECTEKKLFYDECREYFL